VNVVERHIVAVQAFSIDQTEVTVHRYQDCVRAGLCAALAGQTEPGLPVTAVSVEQAEAFCAFAGGRLPTPSEWLFAAAGTDARRFPFGAHGLVCRRASYGLAHGPCAEGGTSPELAGARPEGQTPEGIYDLAGNVAELARTANGSISVHGGSFLSRRAGELKTWSVGPARRAADVGFRCAYESR
jgi:formylglycine-generating enzyme required for sulfatase activity